MPKVSFTSHLRRHVELPDTPFEVDGATVRDALDAVFQSVPRLRGYVLDDLGRVRQHVAVFVDTRPLRDRVALSDSTDGVRELYVMQALSGG